MLKIARVGAAVVAAALVAGLAGRACVGPDRAQAATPCSSAKYTTIQNFHDGKIVRGVDRSIYACSYAVGRYLYLEDAAFPPFAVRGRFVAYVDVNGNGEEDYTDLVVRNTQTGRTVFDYSLGTPDRLTRTGVGAIVLSRSSALAWIACLPDSGDDRCAKPDPGKRAVRRVRINRKVVDEGPLIKPYSLHRGDHRVCWTKGDAQRCAPIP